MNTLTKTSLQGIATFDVCLETMFVEYCTNMSSSVIDIGEENSHALLAFKQGIDTFNQQNQKTLEDGIRDMFHTGETMFMLGGEAMRELERCVAQKILFRLRVVTRVLSRVKEGKFKPFYINHEDIQW